MKGIFFFCNFNSHGGIWFYTQNCPSGISIISLLCKVKTLKQLVEIVNGMNLC